MASKNPPVKNAAFTFRTFLFGRADNLIMTVPTIAVGDFAYSGDGGSFSNPATSPVASPASSGAILVSLAAGEMNHDEVTVRWQDASGAQWYDGAMVLHTVASGQQFDSLSTFNAATTTVSLAASGITNLVFDSSARTAIDATLTASHGSGNWTTGTSSAVGSGAISHTVQVVVDGSPVAGAGVWVTTDVGGANVVAGTLTTDAFGNATFLLDAGTYYAWIQKPGKDFSNPTSITVS